eukprot:1955332-Pyramimonas_sp.AAC.1
MLRAHNDTHTPICFSRTVGPLWKPSSPRLDLRLSPGPNAPQKRLGTAVSARAVPQCLGHERGIGKRTTAAQ